mmetsp:Transcript_11624/g.32173  ORF Transcript_11624/g.32173 Transcript_11624/m.32173 type:complete len:86 (+) Transcript_11624:114-371(+)
MSSKWGGSKTVFKEVHSLNAINQFPIDWETGRDQPPSMQCIFHSTHPRLIPVGMDDRNLRVPKTLGPVRIKDTGRVILSPIKDVQ